MLNQTMNRSANRPLSVQAKSKALYQKGVGLIEVMIAVLVLGVGLLGILTLQKNALQLNQASYYYSQASVMISDITEKIRSNVGSQAEYTLTLGDVPTSTSNCINTACDGDDLAQWQLAQWRARVAQIFPKADAEISISNDIATPSIVVLYFTQENVSNNAQRIQVEFRL